MADNLSKQVEQFQRDLKKIVSKNVDAASFNGTLEKTVNEVLALVKAKLPAHSIVKQLPLLTAGEHKPYYRDALILVGQMAQALKDEKDPDKEKEKDKEKHRPHPPER